MDSGQPVQPLVSVGDGAEVWLVLVVVELVGVAAMLNASVLVPLEILGTDEGEVIESGMEL